MLHLDAVLRQLKLPGGRGRLHLVRYADDFVVVAPTRDLRWVKDRYSQRVGTRRWVFAATTKDRRGQRRRTKSGGAAWPNPLCTVGQKRTSRCGWSSRRSKDDPDPKALACYGWLVREATAPAGWQETAWLRFVAGRAVS